MKSKCSRILRTATSVILTASMMLGTGSTVFAAEEPIKYVSLGDSMTNGYGMDGYEIVVNGESYNVYGFLREVEGSYPYMFNEWLNGENADEEDALIQLATSALRAEDFYYLLTYGTPYAFPGDEYTEWRLIDSNVVREKDLAGTEYSAYADYEVDDVAAIMQAAVADADVISVGVGSNNFSTFMTERIGYCLGQMSSEVTSMFGGNKLATDVEDLLVGMPEEEAAALREIHGRMLELVKLKMMQSVENYDPDYPLGEKGYTLGNLVSDVADAAAYTTVGFMIGYKGTLESVLAYNPDAQVLLVPVTNWIEGLKIAMGEGEDAAVLNLGDIFDTLYTVANVFVADLAVSYTQESEATVAYADVDNVELFSEEIGRTGKIPENTIIRQRMVKNVAGNGGFVSQISMGGMTLPPVTLEEVEAYENGTFQITSELAVYKTLTCDIYLGIEDAILENISNKTVSSDAFVILSSSLMSAVGDAMAAELPNVGVTKTLREATRDAMNSTDALKGLVYIYANYIVGDGILCHTNTVGHDTIYEALKVAYEENGESSSKHLAENLDELYVVALSQLASSEGMTEDILELFEESGLKDAYEATIAALLDFDKASAGEILEDYMQSVFSNAVKDFEESIDSAFDSLGDGYQNAVFCEVPAEEIDKNYNYTAVGGAVIADENSYAQILASELAEFGYGFDEEDNFTMVDADSLPGKAARMSASEEESGLGDADLVTVSFDVEKLTSRIAEILSGEAAADWSKYAELDELEAELEGILNKEEIVKAVESAKNAIQQLYINCAACIAAMDTIDEYVGLDEEQTAWTEQAAALVNAYAYSAVEFGVETLPVLAAISKMAPEALVAVVGLYNPLDGVELTVGDDTVPAGDVLDRIVEATKLFFLPYAMHSGTKTIYVDVPAAETPDVAGDYAMADFLALLGNADLLPTDGLVEDMGHDYIQDKIFEALGLTEGVAVETESFDFFFPNLYAVKVDCGEGGKVDTSAAFKMAYGSSRTIKITADEGYEVEDVTINGKSVGAVDKYTIKGACMNYTVVVTFAEIEG